MPIDGLPLPQRAPMQRHLIEALSRYWSGKPLVAESVPAATVPSAAIDGPLRLQAIRLPDWAAACGVDGVILVPVEACASGGDWQQVDWWLAAFLLLECWHERAWEQTCGSIHSYACRLDGWDSRAWDRAWVNRIGLFLRAWAAHSQGTSADRLFGALPQPEVVMTHDVDAVSKTLPIRLKQGAFNLFNAGRHLAKGEVGKALGKLGTAARFGFGMEDWWTFDALLAAEQRAGIGARFNFYADTRRKTLKRWLLDPGYDCRGERIRNLAAKIVAQRGVVGLHPTFDSCESANLIRQQRECLNDAAGALVSTCRQHWLRFSWRHTWAAQAAAGIGQDTTLMFNDRSGYRAAAALSWRPWSHSHSQAHMLTALPTVLMDSHFYDYQSMTTEARQAAMRHWLGENRDVGGEIAVLWHPHTLTADYGWAAGFQYLLETICETRSCQLLH